jgi:hypothetical protein
MPATQMVRQIWGERVLQSGDELPDSTAYGPASVWFAICYLSFAIWVVGPTCPAVLPSIGQAVQRVGQEAGI